MGTGRSVRPAAGAGNVEKEKDRSACQHCNEAGQQKSEPHILKGNGSCGDQNTQNTANAHGRNQAGGDFRLLISRKTGSERAEQRSPQHGLSKAVDAPQNQDDSGRRKKADQNISQSSKQKSGCNHPSGWKKIPKKTVQELPDGIAEEKGSAHRADL